jgi:MSHA pilin protein MshA
MPSLKQRGFTLIELVVVIVILGILAAFAVPRFMGLEDKARIATLTNMEGTLQSAATMAYGVWEANGAGGNTITVPGVVGNINLTNGYPTAASIQQLLQTTPLAAGFTVVGNTTWRVTSAPTPAQCAFTYTASAGAGQPPVVATVSTTGC